VLISDIAATGTTTATFTIVPKTGLAANAMPYTATVTVSATSGNTNPIALKSFTVSFTVVARDFTMSYFDDNDTSTTPTSGKYTFASQISGTGYSAETLTVKIVNANASTIPTGNLTVTLSDATNFALNIGTGGTVTSATVLAITSLTDGEATFTVKTKPGLNADPAPYTATITISGATGNGITSQTFTVSFQVNAPTGAIVSISWTDNANDDPVISGNTTALIGESLTLSVPDDCDSYYWTIIGGVPADTQTGSHEYNFQKWTVGPHIVSLIVEKDGKEYSSTYTVTVQ